ncbi:hypothetical protein JR316_0009110 [Psilocybe cubensis]|uniref:Uncharacterized protein n=2 Tax=Psilocybe cubensis TaxID=181762 RepID=A0A8H7XV71_PSICU|nr:hypothetical protein JR316_0009110 [Psilocybe cubensis]KAH9478653.1 hypothetical protein JR316_0009110 [Psilocybe cubensis]
MPPPPSESAPLLNEHDTSTIPDSDLPPTNARLSSRLRRYAKIIRVAGLILSIFIVILVIAKLILLKISPISSYLRSITEQKVIGWYIASAITAIIIICTPLPSLLSFTSDFVLLVGTIVCSVRWIKHMPLRACMGRYDPPTREWLPPHPKCKDYQLAINIIMGFTATFGILLAISYALLIIIRVYNVFKFKLPGSGEIRWTVSLNVLEDGHERTYGFTVGAKADSKPTQGPVHL